MQGDCGCRATVEGVGFELKHSAHVALQLCLCNVALHPAPTRHAPLGEGEEEENGPLAAAGSPAQIKR